MQANNNVKMEDKVNQSIILTKSGHLKLCEDKDLKLSGRGNDPFVYDYADANHLE
ncbi:hypothetical protein HDU91_000386, partial [Kappamyces sp. JEL0680]